MPGMALESDLPEISSGSDTLEEELKGDDAPKKVWRILIIGSHVLKKY